MEYEKCAFVLPSHLVRMAALSQCAVDCAIKAYELHDPRIYLQFEDTERKLRDLQSMVARRGRFLQAAGYALDDQSVQGSCTLQIYSGLHITFAAAREIAQNASFIQENRQRMECWAIHSLESARFVNSLVTLNVVALLNRQRRTAELVLGSRHHPAWPRKDPLVAGNQTMRQVDANAALEERVVLCLREIADQAIEIARSVVRWLGGADCSDGANESAVSQRQVREERRMCGECAVKIWIDTVPNP